MRTTLKEAKIAAGMLLNNIKIFSDDKVFGRCSPVYCSTNENVSGYIPSDFNFGHRNVLSVAGSGDIPIEFALRGANNIDCFDINALAEYMMRLKIISVLVLEHNDFLDFYSDASMRNCEKPFNVDVYANKVQKYLDPQTREFWDHIYTLVSNKESLFPAGALIRSSNLFANNSVSYDYLKKYDSFVDLRNYKKLQNILEYVKFNFIESSMLDITNHVNQKYVMIYLSNIAEYLKDMYSTDQLSCFKDFIINYLSHKLDHDGIMVTAYLFNYLNNNGRGNYDIYDTCKREKYFKDIFDFITFPSATYETDKTFDAALIYKKK